MLRGNSLFLAKAICGLFLIDIENKLVTGENREWCSELVFCLNSLHLSWWAVLYTACFYSSCFLPEVVSSTETYSLLLIYHNKSCTMQPISTSYCTQMMSYFCSLRLGFWPELRQEAVVLLLHEYSLFLCEVAPTSEHPIHTAHSRLSGLRFEWATPRRMFLSATTLNNGLLSKCELMNSNCKWGFQCELCVRVSVCVSVCVCVCVCERVSWAQPQLLYQLVSECCRACQLRSSLNAGY